MKVLAINGSPRKRGNTDYLLREVLSVIEKEGIKCEIVQIGGKKVNGCTACMKCKKEKEGRCHIKNDLLNEVIEKMVKADAIIIGSPVYFTDVTAETKALLDVAGYSLRAAGNPLRRKIGAAVVAVRREGGIHTFDTINHFFQINEMIVPGSSYWNIGIGSEKGDVAEDAEGIKTMKILGANIVWLLKKLNE